jgi:hypothetical protein
MLWVSRGRLVTSAACAGSEVWPCVWVDAKECREPDVEFRETRSTRSLRVVCRRISQFGVRGKIRPLTKSIGLCELVELDCRLQAARKATSSDLSFAVFVRLDSLYIGRPC